MDTRQKSLGIILIFLGIIFLLENLNIITFNFLTIWPVFVILGGIGFILGYMVNRRYISFVMPGTILTIYGVLFMDCNVYSWELMQFLWPIFLLGPGIGFFLLYFLRDHDKEMLIPGITLTVLSFLFLFRYIEYLKYWPVLMIIGGIVLIFWQKKE